MPHSYAEILTLTCAHCGRDFDAQFWLIVDAAERPDLLERIRAGTLHDEACPHCGDPGHMDAPLLLYRPDDEPTILFSPAEQTSAEEDREHARYLVETVREGLGDSWQDVWVGEGLASVPRNELPALLSDDPGAAMRQLAKQAASQMPPELREIIDELAASGIEIRTQDDFQAALATRPDLQAKLAANVQGAGGMGVPPQFRDDFEQAQEAVQRYRRTGDRSELDTAVAAWERILRHPSFSSTIDRFQLAILNNSGGVHLQRYWAAGWLDDLNRAMELCQSAIQRMPPDSPELLPLLNTLAQGLSARYERMGNLQDLDQAVRLGRRAVVLAPDGSPSLPPSLSNLAGDLQIRHERTGNLQDLEEAVGYNRQAVALTSKGAPDLSLSLNNLAVSLSVRHERTGNLQDLKEAVNVGKRAVALASKEDPSLSMYLGNLAGYLRTNYERSGDIEDLEEAVGCGTRAVALTQAGSPDLPLYLNNLALCLYVRYERTGDLRDLEEAVDVGKRAVALTAKEEPSLPIYLGNLAGYLRTRYDRTDDLLVLEEMVACGTRAVALTPADSPDLPLYINNLAQGLSARYQRTGKLADLEEAVGLGRRAVLLTPEGSPNLPPGLSNIADDLRIRYERMGELQDLEEAVGCSMRAVELTPKGSPDLPLYLNNLALSLSARHERTGNLQDLEEATQSYHRACQIGLLVKPEVAVSSTRSWGNWALDRRAWNEAVAAYSYGRQAIDLLVATQPGRSAKESWLKEVQGLPANTAYALAKLDRLEEAVEMQEAGRARLLAEALEANRRDLERLPGLGRAELLAEYRDASERLAALQQSGQPSSQLFEGSSTRSDYSNLRQQMESTRSDLDDAIAAIRQVIGYEDFFLPPSFEKIQQAVRPGAPLVYLVTTSAASVALVVQADQTPGVSAVWLDDLPEATLREVVVGPADGTTLGGYLGAYQNWLRNSRDHDARQHWFDTLDRTTRWLWDAVMAPLLDHLARSSPLAPRAALIPTGHLALLPLHAAWTADTTMPNGRRYALDAVTFNYAASARALSDARDLAARVTVDGILAVDNPDGSLVFARQEVAAVRSYFPAARSNVLQNAAATHQAVLDQLPDFPVYHFSTHGRAGRNEPLESSLMMAGGAHLTLRDLLEQRLAGARLAVLSACETGIPGTKLPDEVVSLPSGFAQAGVAGVVASLWAVNDMSTAMLMERFYRHWREDGLQPADALCRAQIWLRDATNEEMVAYFEQDVLPALTERMPTAVAADFAVSRFRFDSDARSFAYPFYWAAFTLTGV